MKRRRDTEFGVQETRVGICCRCKGDGLALFKIPELLRWRCDPCFEWETGFRHHLAPAREPPRIVLP